MSVRKAIICITILVAVSSFILVASNNFSKATSDEMIQVNLFGNVISGNPTNLDIELDNRDKKIKAFMYLRKTLWMYRDVLNCGGGGALGRVRHRQTEVINELRLTEEQLKEIDDQLGIARSGQKAEQQVGGSRADSND